MPRSDRPRPHFRRHAPLIAAALALAVLSNSCLTPVFSWEPEFVPIQSMDDPRLASLNRAVAIWNDRLRPTRRTADMVCLVPDLASFFDALALWDEQTYFPILIDEPETTIRFLRAFRPRSVLVWSGPQRSLSPAEAWATAWWAVVRSASSLESPNSEQSRLLLGSSRTPGLVLTSPASPTFAGAVALAAGHRQGIYRVEFDHDGHQQLTMREALGLAAEIERLVRQQRPDYAILGDDCDFLTLACDWPDRYHVDQGEQRGDYALDDLLGRNFPSGSRYAYVGRLIGTPARSMYQAMCSLFLQPQTPLLFDGYTGRGRPWSDYGMESTAADMATRFDSVTWIHDRGRAGIDEWRSVFGPRNRFDLIFVNSSGTPKAFNLAGNSGKTEDIPLGRPAAIYMIHSLSAARPNDTGTLAGRWLANGAFLYFGSLNEPYLPAFRTPHLAWQLLAAGAPVSAALAKLPQEDATGAPWRLRLIGDPLYRVAQTDNSPRVPNVALSGDWKSLAPSPVPPDTANNAFRLAWCREMAYVAAQEGGAGNAEWARQLLKIQPGALSGTGRTDYEALLADWVMNTAESKDDVKREVQARAGSDDSDVLRRALDARR